MFEKETFFAVLIVFLLLSPAIATEIEFEKGDTVKTDNPDFELYIAQGFALNISEIVEHQDGISLGEADINITSNSSESLRHILWVYDVSNAFENETILRFTSNTSSGVNVDYSFSGVNYKGSADSVRIKKGGETIDTFENTSSISWSSMGQVSSNFSVVAVNSSSSTGGEANNTDTNDTSTNTTDNNNTDTSGSQDDSTDDSTDSSQDDSSSSDGTTSSGGSSGGGGSFSGGLFGGSSEDESPTVTVWPRKISDLVPADASYSESIAIANNETEAVELEFNQSGYPATIMPDSVSIESESTVEVSLQIEPRPDRSELNGSLNIYHADSDQKLSEIEYDIFVKTGEKQHDSRATVHMETQGTQSSGLKYDLRMYNVGREESKINVTRRLKLLDRGEVVAERTSGFEINDTESINEVWTEEVPDQNYILEVSIHEDGGTRTYEYPVYVEEISEQGNPYSEISQILGLLAVILIILVLVFLKRKNSLEIEHLDVDLPKIGLMNHIRPLVGGSSDSITAEDVEKASSRAKDLERQKQQLKQRFDEGKISSEMFQSRMQDLKQRKKQLIERINEMEDKL